MLVAVDEKVIHLHGCDVNLWATMDKCTGEVFAPKVTRELSCFEAPSLLGKVWRKCAGKLPRVLVDGDGVYFWAFQRPGFERWSGMAFGPRSAIEAFSLSWITGTECARRGSPSRVHSPG